MKTLATGVTTYTSNQNGIERIEVIEPTEVKARFIKTSEFKRLLKIIKDIPTGNINHIDFKIKNISFEIYRLQDKLRIDNIYIDDTFMYLTAKQFKTIFKTLNND